MPLISRPNVIAFSAALPESKRCAARGVCGSILAPRISTTMPTGTLTANSHCHPATDEDAGGNGWAERGRGGSHHHAHAESSPEQRPRIDEADEGAVQAHH